MPYLTNKPKAGTPWIPSQVAYGVDCSDPDPAKWTAFGQFAEQQQAKHDPQAVKSASKALPQERS